MQQDIVPHPRTQITPPPRPTEPVQSANAGQRMVYERRTVVMQDVIPAPKPAVSSSLMQQQAPEPSGVTTITEITETLVSETPVTNTIETLAPTAKQRALEKALQNARKSLVREKRKTKDLKRLFLVFAAVLLVGVTGYVSIDTWLTNRQVKAGGVLTTSTGLVGGVGQYAVEAEGKDETVVETNALANYTVAASLPRALFIDKINVAARVLPMSVNANGAVQAPVNIYDAGWYNGSVKPGEVGAVFIDGHASGPTRQGLFAYLDKLTKGDTLQVEKGDGTKLKYRVVKTEVVPLEGLDMKKVLLPVNGVTRGLNIMTCTGKWIEEKKTFDHRVVVYTEQVS